MKNYQRTACYVCALLSFTQVATAQTGRSLTFKDMAQIQDQILKSVHSVKAQISRELTFLADGDGKETGKNSISYIWFKEGRKVRMRYRYYSADFKEKKEYNKVEDTVNTAAGFKTVYFNSPEFPQRVDESSVTSGSGVLGPEMPEERAFVPTPLVDMLFQISYVNNCRTLLEAANANPKARVAPVQEGNKRYFEVKFRLNDKDQHTLLLDPEAHYLIRKHEAITDEGVGHSEVSEYGRLGHFVYPAIIRGDFESRKTKAKLHSITKCKVLTVNQPLEPGSFDVHFPPGLLVTDKRTRRAMIWGEDDKPKIVFNNDQEYQDWIYRHTRTDPQMPSESSSRLYIWFIGAGLFLSVVLPLSIKLYRHRAKSA